MTAIEVIGLDGSVQPTAVESGGLTIVGGRVYAATPSGVTEIGADGHRRLLAPGIAASTRWWRSQRADRVTPAHTDHPGPAAPTTGRRRWPHDGNDHRHLPPPRRHAAPASTSPAAAAIDDPTDEQDDPSAAGVAAIIAIVVIGGVVAVIWWRRRRAITA